LSYLSTWQSFALPDKSKLASQTFHVFSRIIVSLHKLKIEMKKKGAIFKVQTSVLSILVVEYGFSIVQRISHVFTVNQYNYIMARVGWNLKQQKSKHTRQFGLLTDNETGTNRVYGTVNIKIEPLKLQKVK
jgi:hypothetical protein